MTIKEIKGSDELNSEKIVQESRTLNYDHINPSHYKRYSEEVIDMMIKIYGKEKVAIYCELNAFKYRMRAGTKPDQPIERDLEKENWYLNKKKELN